MKNKIIIFTGPSGVGKATIEHELFKSKDLSLALSISATTRKIRPGEENHKHYHFITEQEFDQKIKNNEFIEYSQHFSNKYGTLKSELKRIADENMNPFIEVETNGAQELMSKLDKEDYIGIFVAPPSKEALASRIRARGSETEDQLIERLNRLEEEMSHQKLFQHTVVNDDLDSAVEQIKAILKKELI